MKNLLLLILFITAQFIYAQSNQELKRNIEIDSTTSKFYYDKGVDKIESKDYNGALHDFDEAIKLTLSVPIVIIIELMLKTF